DKARTLLNYNRNPGTFAFRSPNVWGKLEFAAQAPESRIRPEMAEFVSAAKEELEEEPAKIGVPITVEVPGPGLLASVNIVDEDGGVVREVIAGESHPEGPLTVYWDGRDAFSKSLVPGKYRWAAYFHKPLKAVYQGGVGSSGHPYYKTRDGKGGWGGDHSDPIDASADEDSLYFLWPVAEAGESLVRTDYDGNVIWRKDPFVGGGFGPYFSTASNGKYVFLTRSDSSSPGPGKTSLGLVRLLKESGALTVWDEETRNDELELARVDHKLLPDDTIALPIQAPSGKNQPKYEGGMARQPDGVGLAASDERVYAASYGAGKVFVVDPESGSILDELDCPGVRGLDLSSEGDLYAVSFPAPGEGKIIRFEGGNGLGQVIVSEGLNAPWDVAVNADGMMYVSDLGTAQQIKVFDHHGDPVGVIGNRGGRPWQGLYDPEKLSFLRPAGLTVDRDGALLVSESSPPKVFSRIDPESGELLNRWYGPGVYWNATWPMPGNPRNIFYLLPHAVGRADLGGVGETGVPNAYWNLERSGYPGAGDIESRIPQPEVLEAENGSLYFAKDSGNHVICLFEEDRMRPVASWTAINRDENGNYYRNIDDRWVEVWVDQNGDGQVQESEKTRWDSLGDGSNFTSIAEGASSMHMEANGDLYFATPANSIVCVPSAGFGPNGLIQWDLESSYRAVPVVLPGLDRMHTGFRSGILGVRLDGEGNLYTLFNTAVKGLGGDFDFADAETAKRMMEGMGHTSRSNLVKFAKFDPKGRLIWMAGRKATAGAAPGEMYHFWNMAGLVNDRYIAGGSEWGQIYFYTYDGFFAGALMNNPGDISEPGPYTFGGETSGGRVAYFEESGELWAYSSGMAYKVEGFSEGRIEGESRAYGTLELDRIYGADETMESSKEAIRIVAVKESPLLNSNLWSGVEEVILKDEKGAFATAQFAYDESNLYARIAVEDESPLENGATANKLVFKGGDSAGFVLGPQRESIEPGLGDIRIMAARIQGEDRVVAMKSVSEKSSRFEVYETPAAGRWEFDFVGEVPEAEVTLVETDRGSVALFSVPRSFLEFDLSSGEPLRGDVEIRRSGIGHRGLQTTRRSYLFAPSTSETTMVDDIPTEARLYPQYWGEVIVE
ncbi:MAG: hypothetical protein ACQKBT_10490, partial [Puniceicoccales bacterium]